MSDLGACVPCATERFTRAMRDTRKNGGLRFPVEQWEPAVEVVSGTGLCRTHVTDGREHATPADLLIAIALATPATAD